MGVKFGYLYNLLQNDSHNTFSDFIAYTMLTVNEEVLEVKGHRPVDMAKKVAEKKYFHYLSTCSQAHREMDESNHAWTIRKKAGLFDYTKY